MRYRIPMLLHIILFLHGFLTYAGVPKSSTKKFYEKGIGKYEKGNFRKAIRDFTLVIKSDPEFLSAYIYRAMAKIEVNRLNDALTDLNNILREFPDNYEAIYLKGLIFEKIGDDNKANELYTKAIELSSDFTLAYARRSNSFIKQGNYISALEDVNQILAIEPLNSIALEKRDLIIRLIGEILRPEKIKIIK